MVLSLAPFLKEREILIRNFFLIVCIKKDPLTDFLKLLFFQILELGQAGKGTEA